MECISVSYEAKKAAESCGEFTQLSAIASHWRSAVYRATAERWRVVAKFIIIFPPKIRESRTE